MTEGLKALSFLDITANSVNTSNPVAQSVYPEGSSLESRGGLIGKPPALEAGHHGSSSLFLSTIFPI